MVRRLERASLTHLSTKGRAVLFFDLSYRLVEVVVSLLNSRMPGQKPWHERPTGLQHLMDN